MRERGRENGTDRNIALTVLTGRAIECQDNNSCKQSYNEQAHNRGDPEENRSCCTCKAYIGKAVACKALVPQHHKVADDTRSQSHERSCQIGILHEVIVEEHLEIYQEIPGKLCWLRHDSVLHLPFDPPQQCVHLLCEGPQF